jgi:hypothetical protein
MNRIFLQEKVVEATKQKEEKRKKPKPEEQEGTPPRQHCPSCSINQTVSHTYHTRAIKHRRCADSLLPGTTALVVRMAADGQATPAVLQFSDSDKAKLDKLLEDGHTVCSENLAPVGTARYGY